MADRRTTSILASAPPARAPSLAAWIAVAACVLSGLAWLFRQQHYYSGWMDDDAFISFRYARNWADGLGLVFNPGERVEGYTNFLWTVLLGSLHRMGGDLPATARRVGCLAAWITVIWVGLCMRRLLGRSSVGPLVRTVCIGLAPVLLCLSDSWAAWSVGGLENVFSALLLTASFHAYLVWLETSARRGWIACACFLALAVANHPTNALFAVIMSAHALWQMRQRHLRHDPWVFLAVLLVPLGAWTLWRLAYYGDLLPNTFYAKVGFTWFAVQRGGRFFAEALRAFPLGYAATLLLAFGWARRRDWSRPGWILIAAVLGYSAAVIGVGGELFPAFRSLVVLLPFFAMLLACFVAEIAAAVMQRSISVRSAALAGATVFVLLGAFLPEHFSRRNRILDAAIRQGRTALSTTAARQLRLALPANTLFAHSGAGLIAYYTNFPWIDTLGLTDRHIAHKHVTDMGRGAAGHEKGDGQYVWSRRPDYVMFAGNPISDAKPGNRFDRELFAIPEFRSTYRLVRFPFQFQAPSDDVPRELVLHLWQRFDAAGSPPSPEPPAGSTR